MTSSSSDAGTAEHALLLHVSSATAVHANLCSKCNCPNGTEFVHICRLNILIQLIPHLSLVNQLAVHVHFARTTTHRHGSANKTDIHILVSGVALDASNRCNFGCIWHWTYIIDHLHNHNTRTACMYGTRISHPEVHSCMWCIHARRWCSSNVFFYGRCPSTPASRCHRSDD